MERGSGDEPPGPTASSTTSSSLQSPLCWESWGNEERRSKPTVRWLQLARWGAFRGFLIPLLLVSLGDRNDACLFKSSPYHAKNPTPISHALTHFLPTSKHFLIPTFLFAIVFPFLFPLFRLTEIFHEKMLRGIIQLRRKGGQFHLLQCEGAMRQSHFPGGRN